MTQYSVTFSNVGRTKATFSAVVPALSERHLLRLVRPHLRSRDISLTWDDARRSGCVFAGFQSVGEFIAEELKKT